MKWHKFDPARWRRKLPKPRVWVLLTFPPRHAPTCILPRSFALGYLKFAAGDRKSPMFITPGIGGTPDAWAEMPEGTEGLVLAAWRSLGATVHDLPKEESNGHS